MSQPQLTAVPIEDTDSDRFKPVDLKKFPEKLMQGAILDHRSHADIWVPDINTVIILPLQPESLEKVIGLYQSEPVLNDNHLAWFLKYPEELLEKWREFTIYFLGTVHVTQSWQIRVKALVYDKAAPKWTAVDKAKINLDKNEKPKFIMMR